MKNNEVDFLRKNARNVAYCLLLLLVILMLYVSYIQIIEAPFLAANPLNRRSAELSGRIERGQILDRNGKQLAVSIQNNTGQFYRKYPYGAIMAQLVGYDSKKYGQAGLEATYNEYLSGFNNPEYKLGPVSHLWTKNRGNNLILTIDADLQQLAYRALGNHRGAVVAVSPRTGAILALVSKPSFDPNTVDRNWQTVSRSTDSPLLNRAVQGLYPPGSTIKIMTAGAALADGITDLNRTFLCNGALKIGPDYVLHDAENVAHGKIDLSEALTVSCNVTFGQIAMELGAKRMANTFEQFGFSRVANPELQEVPSQLPDFAKLSEGELAQTGIGQGRLLVTPLKMAMLAEAFADGGVMKRPYLVSKIVAPDGAVIKQFTPQEWLRPLDRRWTDAVKKMMVAVVNQGTGKAAQLAGVSVAGKTGTAENPHGRPHAWFIGFAPAEDPQIAVAVIVENAGYGGDAAAPIARQLFAQVLR
ncbi:Hypothetical protein LUCI_3202 [Lucifera butyrica]|uniref:Uncharacterized protein n=1 Tax=Lucifera butyrica TaxID=1351585 RepID=A0A498RAN0_9FIRM|nr:penicillin-binding transpeptidase domain-containing protein [Lucifera butyrica]VBB07937.1 Hypothetical protein LUCI_3202 [Lucifera butyrica]